jgi:F-type H+-transporting ATPase subunit epsilon
MAKALQVDIVSADRAVWSGEAVQVSAKTVIGEIGILAGHEPVLAILAPGHVRVTLDNGEKILVEAEDGFISFDHDTLTVVAGNAQLV